MGTNEGVIQIGRITCCRDCKDKRFPGCHAVCEDYIRERKELDEYNELIREKYRLQYINYRPDLNKLDRTRKYK